MPHQKPSILVICCLLLSFLSAGQSSGNVKQSHFGIFTEIIAAKVTSNSEYAGSVFKPGISLGVYQHFDLSSRSQMRVGGAFSYFNIASKDYSPLFPADFDPSTGKVDIEKSYVLYNSTITQINIPVNFKYKFSDATNHIYVSGGLEGRFVISQQTEGDLIESDVPLAEIDAESYYEYKNSGLVSLLEIGYEMPLENNKLNFSILWKYGLFTQVEGQNFANAYYSYKGNSIDLGIGIGLVF